VATFEEIIGEAPATTPTQNPIPTFEEIIGEAPATEQQAPTKTGEPEQFTMDNLVKNQDWLKDARTIYKHDKGEDYKGSDKDLDYWFRNKHSRLGNDLTSMVATGIDAAGDMPDDVKEAWVNSLNTWDNTEGTLGSAFNALYQTITDPSMIASIGAGAAAGSVVPGLGTAAGGLSAGLAKIIGSRGVAQLAKLNFKAQLQKELVEKVGTKATEEFVKKGTSKAISDEVLKEARKKAAKTLAVNQGTVYGAEGAAYAATDDLFRQSFEIDIEEAMEDPQKTETDYAQTAIATLAGGLLGGIFGGSSRAFQKIGDNRAVRRMKIAAEREAEVRPKLPETTKTYSHKTDGVVGARKIADEAQEELEVDGVLTMDIGEVVPLQSLREINEQLNAAGFSDVAKIGPGKYAATKLTQLRSLRPEDRDIARTRTQRILGRVGRIFRSDAGVKGTTEEAQQRLSTGRRRVDTARQLAERQLETSFKRLNKAVKKDFGVKNLAPAQAKLVNDALRGSEEAVEELAKTAPDVLKEVQTMRGNVASLQNELLETGAIREGSNLETKIKSSMGMEGKDELYLTTSYEKFDNPNWGKEVTTRTGKRGKTIIEEAEDYLVSQAAANNKDFSIALNKFRAGKTLNAKEQEVYNRFMSRDGEINNTIAKILDTNEDDVLKVFSDNAIISKGNAAKILSGKKAIPEEIRMLMGEYEDPFVNYAKTVSKLNQTIAQIDYEKDIVELANKGLIQGVRTSKSSSGDFVPVRDVLPARKDIDPKLGMEDIDTGMGGIYAYPEVAAGIINGNEIFQTTLRPLQAYLALQGHTRAAKTVYSPTAIARNFIGAGWMAAGAGYLNPRNLSEIPKVMKGLYKMSDEDLNAEMEKGIALGYLQSGTDLGSFRAALSDAGDNSFWNFTNKSLSDKNSLAKRARKFNVEAVKFYQAMDDMWKQYAFLNEKGTYRQVLADKGIDPDRVVRTFNTGDGKLVRITELDEYAANEVAKHMQNYAGVPQFVRTARLLPAADFFAFTTEIIRTQKNIIKTSLKDIKEGRDLMKLGERNADGALRGQAQSRAGQRRLGSVIAAQSAAPALAAAGYAVTGMDQPAVDENGKELPYTVKEGYEAFDQDWQKGADFLYLGVPENGKARRINLSYLNPWSKTQDPIRAGIRALSSDSDIDSSLNNAFAESVWQPLKETFGPSMLADAALSMAYNVDAFGRPIFKETDTAGEKFRSGVVTTLETFEPGLIKSARDISTSLGTPDSKIKDAFGVGEGFTRSGRIKRFDDQIVGLSGIKPETIDIKDTLGFKLSALKRNMGESGKTFERAYQQRTPITSDELVEAYSDGLRKEYEYAKEMFDVITKAKSIGLSNAEIIRAVTDEGLFKNRLDKSMLLNLVNRGVFVPAPPKMKDIYKWGISTKRRTGTKPPIDEAQKEIFKIYRRYAGATTGQR
jgi:hypothetical protein